jgi:D-glycero-alpha-D-manno-heptose-7-phosphate kinase
MVFSFLCTAPHRVSLLGGGSDVPDYLREREYGASLTFTINPAITTIVKSHSGLFDEKIRLNYSVTELCDSVSSIRNAIARAALEHYDFERPIYISTVTDIPDRCGLSSSSAFLLSICAAMQYNQMGVIHLDDLAYKAQHIEYELGRACGYQDSFAIAHGGLNFFKYTRNPVGGPDVVRRYPLPSASILTSCINDDFYMIWLGQRCETYSRLATRKHLASASELDSTDSIRDIALEAWDALSNFGDLPPDHLQDLLERAWDIKKSLLGTANPVPPFMEETLRTIGAFGFKLLGAGGGGFLGLFLSGYSLDKLKQVFPRQIILKPGLSPTGMKLYDLTQAPYAMLVDNS